MFEHNGATNLKKLAIFSHFICLFFYAYCAHAAETAAVNVGFVITNNNSKAVVKYELVDPRGMSHKGTLYPNSAWMNRSYDTAVINFDDLDESFFGVYMLHYRSLDAFWNNTLFSNDSVVTVQKNSKVLCAISREGEDIKVTVVDLADLKKSAQNTNEIPGV